MWSYDYSEWSRIGSGDAQGREPVIATRPSQPEPFVRGAPHPAGGGVPYPRANPGDVARLPADVWHAASVPAGVRLELVGDAQAIDIAYRTATGNLGYRGDGAGIVFSVWRGGRRVCEEEAVLGDGLIRLSLGDGSPDRPAVIYLPEGMQPLVLSLTAVKGEIAPAPSLPRWLAYGDAVTQGWIASGPSQGWAAITARKSGLDLVNLGYAGSGQCEIIAAEHLAGLPADVISISYGSGFWTRTPHSAPMLFESVRAFLALVRTGHPATPMVVMSPIRRGDAEHTPNKLGATLADLRDAVEAATRDRIVSGDTMLSLVGGEEIIGPEHLVDGNYPGDEGHKRIASAASKALGAALQAARDAPNPPVLVDSDEGLGLGLALVGGNGHVDEVAEPLPELDVAFQPAEVDPALVGLDPPETIDGSPTDDLDAAFADVPVRGDANPTESVEAGPVVLDAVMEPVVVDAVMEPLLLDAAMEPIEVDDVVAPVEIDPVTVEDAAAADDEVATGREQGSEEPSSVGDVPREVPEDEGADPAPAPMTADDDITSVLAPDVAAAWSLY